MSTRRRAAAKDQVALPEPAPAKETRGKGKAAAPKEAPKETAVPKAVKEPKGRAKKAEPEPVAEPLPEPAAPVKRGGRAKKHEEVKEAAVEPEPVVEEPAPAPTKGRGKKAAAKTAPAPEPEVEAAPEPAPAPAPAKGRGKKAAAPAPAPGEPEPTPDVQEATPEARVAAPEPAPEAAAAGDNIDIDALDEMKMPELKEIATKLGLKAPKKKADLIEAIRSHVAAAGAATAAAGDDQPGAIVANEPDAKAPEPAVVDMEVEPEIVAAEIPADKDHFCFLHMATIPAGAKFATVLLRRGRPFVRDGEDETPFVLSENEYQVEDMECPEDNVLCGDCVELNRQRTTMPRQVPVPDEPAQVVEAALVEAVKEAIVEAEVPEPEVQEPVAEELPEAVPEEPLGGEVDEQVDAPETVECQVVEPQAPEPQATEPEAVEEESVDVEMTEAEAEVEVAAETAATRLAEDMAIDAEVEEPLHTVQPEECTVEVPIVPSGEAAVDEPSVEAAEMDKIEEKADALEANDAPEVVETAAVELAEPAAEEVPVTRDESEPAEPASELAPDMSFLIQSQEAPAVEELAADSGAPAELEASEIEKEDSDEAESSPQDFVPATQLEDVATEDDGDAGAEDANEDNQNVIQEEQVEVAELPTVPSKVATPLPTRGASRAATPKVTTPKPVTPKGDTTASIKTPRTVTRKGATPKTVPNKAAKFATPKAALVASPRPNAHLIELAFERNLTELAHAPVPAAKHQQDDEIDQADVEIDDAPEQGQEADLVVEDEAPADSANQVDAPVEEPVAMEDVKEVEVADNQVSEPSEPSGSQSQENTWSSQQSVGSSQASSQRSFPGDLDPHSFVLPNFFSPSHAGNSKPAARSRQKPEHREPIKPSVEKMREVFRGKRYQGEGVAGFDDAGSQSLGVTGVRLTTEKASRKRAAKTAPATPRKEREEEEETTRALTPGGPAMRKLPGGIRSEMTPAAGDQASKRIRRGSQLNGWQVEVIVDAPKTVEQLPRSAPVTTDVELDLASEQPPPELLEESKDFPVPVTPPRNVESSVDASRGAMRSRQGSARASPVKASSKNSSPKATPAPPKTPGKENTESSSAPAPKSAAKAIGTPGRLRNQWAVKVMSPLRGSMRPIEEDEEAETY